MQGIVNYDPSYPSRILIGDLKKVLNSFAEGLDKMDIVNAPQSTCSKAEACLDKRDGTFETRLENKKGVKDKREGKIKISRYCEFANMCESCSYLLWMGLKLSYFFTVLFKHPVDRRSTKLWYSSVYADIRHPCKSLGSVD